MEFPPALPHGLEMGPQEVGKVIARAAFGIAVDESAAVQPVNDPVRGNRRVRQGGESGEEILQPHDLGTGSTGCDPAGGPDYAGYAEPSFPGGRLAAAEWARRTAVFALDDPGAIVAGKHDVGVVRQAKPRDLVDDPADMEIQFLDGVAVESAGRSSAEFCGCIQRDMGHVRAEVHEERLVRAAPDEFDGFVGITLRQRRLIGRLFDHPSVAQQDDILGPVVARGRAEVNVESLRRRQKFGFPAVVRVAAQPPFADHCAGIPGRPQDLGKRDLTVVKHRVAALRIAGFGHAYRVAAGHHRRARGAAERLRIHAGQLQPLGGECVYAGRSDVRRAERADIAVTQVVGEYEDDIRRRSGPCARHRQGRKRSADSCLQHCAPGNHGQPRVLEPISTIALNLHYSNKFGRCRQARTTGCAIPGHRRPTIEWACRSAPGNPGHCCLPLHGPLM